jgi:ketol-acid reductoisomerase
VARSGGKGKYRSAITGRYVTAEYARKHPKTTVKDSRAGRFAHKFMKKYPDTFHELSKR